MVKPSKATLYCPNCPKTYVLETWYQKHILHCASLGLKKSKNLKGKSLGKIDPKCITNSPVTADLLPEVFSFDDDFFAKRTYAPSYANYLDHLKSFGESNAGSLRVLHLNINSLF